MKNKIIGERVAQLVRSSQKSDYKMSAELGHSNTYFGQIIRHKAYPSMGSFLALCDYFDITPTEFFSPHITREGEELCKKFMKLSDQHKKDIFVIIDALCQEDNPE